MKIFYCCFSIFIVILPTTCSAPADNEIQVYASPTTTKGNTMVELHQNYTFNGIKESRQPAFVRRVI